MAVLLASINGYTKDMYRGTTTGRSTGRSYPKPQTNPIRRDIYIHGLKLCAAISVHGFSRTEIPVRYTACFGSQQGGGEEERALWGGEWLIDS